MINLDYKTNALSRKEIRFYARYFRKLFDVSPEEPFPVLEALEKVPDVFEGSSVEIVEDNKLSANVMCICKQNNFGAYTILIKQSVYEGAYEKGIGAYLGFILHEICHLFLLTIGYTPIYARSFENKTIPAYCSVEWQAKALAGEIMIPYDECKNLSIQEIRNRYHVSYSFAAYFDKNVRKKGGGYYESKKTHY